MTIDQYLAAKRELESCQKAMETLIMSRADSFELEKGLAHLKVAMTGLEKLIDEATVEERQAVAFL